MDTYHQQLHLIFNDLANQYTERQSWQTESEILEDDPQAAFYFIERLLENAKTDLAPFSNRQIGLGLDFIFSNTHSNLANDFKQADVPYQRKEKAVRSLVNLFRDVMAPRCEPQLSAGSKESHSDLQYICYMFWDVCPWSTWLNDSARAAMLDVLPTLAKLKSPEAMNAAIQQPYKTIDAETKGYYEAIAYVMEECLQIDNPACVESGLHGLGHLVPFLPDIAVPIIDRYLKNKKNLDENLVRYAQAARTGMIL